MNNIIKSIISLFLLMIISAFSNASNKVGYLIDYDNISDISNANERAAALFFIDKCANGEIITPNDITKISFDEYKAIWIHVDRIGLEKGYENLPAKLVSSNMVEALKKYVTDGGSLLLTKFATQLLAPIGRVDAKFSPNIFSSGNGGEGSDTWTIQAQIGFDNITNDPSQYYDHRGHDIYNQLSILETGVQFPYDSFPMEGPNAGASMWREDHNCMWDFNGLSYIYEGKNVIEKFQNETSSLVLGTWGHVKDYAVGGIIEFLPTATFKGKIIANGLAACEWSPQWGVNKYQSNFEKLTENCLSYLVGGDITTNVEQNHIENNLIVSGLEGAISFKNVISPTWISVYYIDGNQIAKTMISKDTIIELNIHGVVLVEIIKENKKTVYKAVIK